MRGASYIGFVVNDSLALDDRQPRALTRFVEVDVLPIRPHRIEHFALQRALDVEKEERVRPWGECEGLDQPVNHLLVVAPVATECNHRALPLGDARELDR